MKFIFVDQEAIKTNERRGEAARPPIIVLSEDNDKSSSRHFSVEIDGPSRIVYEPGTPKDGFRRVWIETEAPLSCK